MDLTQLLESIINVDTVKGISETTNTSAEDVTNVLAASLPSLLSGAKAQADNAKTSESFLNAMLQHGADDTSDVKKFMTNVDLEDGGKIVNHLLENKVDDTAENVSRVTGVSTVQILKILAAAAPLLMSILGKQAKQSGNNSVTNAGTSSIATSLMSNLLGGKNSSSLMTSLVGAALLSQLGGNSNGGLLGSLLGAGQQQQQSPSLLSALLGGGQTQQQSPSLLGALLGAQQPAQQQAAPQQTSSSLLSALLGGQQQPQAPQVQQPQNSSSLLSALLGAQQPSQAQQVQQPQNSSDLLSALLGNQSSSQATQQNQLSPDLLSALLGGTVQQPAQQTTSTGKKKKKADANTQPTVTQPSGAGLLGAAASLLGGLLDVSNDD